MLIRLHGRRRNRVNPLQVQRMDLRHREKYVIIERADIRQARKSRYKYDLAGAGRDD